MLRFVNLLSVFSLTLATFCYAGEMGTSEESSHAKILEFQGDVSYQKAGTDQWIKVTAPGVELAEKDKIKTGPDSSAELEFYGDRKTGHVTVHKKTEMTLETFRHDEATSKETTLLDVAVGNILIQAEKLKGDSKFEVKTPASMVGIRGTTFSVSASEEE